VFEINGWIMLLSKCLEANSVEHEKMLQFKVKWLLYVPTGFYILPTERMYVFCMDLRKKMAAIYFFSIN
jgi:hypothetical protein